MSTPRRSATRIRRILASASGDFAALPLEPRQLLAYLSEPIERAFDLPTELFDLQPPTGAIVEGFGWTSVSLGDLDGDGRSDFAVAAPGRVSGEAGPEVNGAVFIYSGATREVMTTLPGTAPLFGFTLLNLGDLTDDGKAEIAVGSPHESVVRIYSAASGALHRTFTGEEGSEFGYALALQLGDDAETQEDGLIVGAPSHGSAGAVYSFSLATGDHRFRVDGPVAGSRFGHGVAGMRDLHGGSEFSADGVQEVLASAPQGPENGYLYLLDGLSGETLTSLTSSRGYGSAVLGVTDGSYAIVGVPSVINSLGRVATIGAYSSFGQDVVISEFNSFVGQEASFGSTILSVGDLDGRIGDEFVVGAPAETPAESKFYVMAFSSPGGSLLGQTTPAVVGATGFGALGDVNADGLADLLRTTVNAEGETTTTALSSLTYFALQRPNVVSRDGTFLVFNGPDLVGGYWGYTQPLLSGARYAIRDGEFILLTSLPGVGDDFEVSAVGDDGTIVGFTTQGPPESPWQPPVRLEATIIIDGVRHRLDDYIAAVQGPTDINVANFNFRRVGPSGDVLITEQVFGDFATPRAWVLTATDHILIYLWNGYVEDQATDGTVLGTEQVDQTVIGRTHLWTRAGGKVAIPDFFNAARMNDDHEIIGLDPNGDLAVFRGNAVTRLARASDIVPGAASATWEILGIDDQGRGVARLSWYMFNPNRYDNGYFTYLVEEDNQLVRLDSLIALGTPPFGLWEDTRQYPRQYDQAAVIVLNSGDLLINSSFLSQADSSEGLIADTRGVRSVSASATSMRAVAINPDGIPISFSLVGSEWQGRSLSGLAGTLSIDGDLAVFVDPKDGQTYAVTLGRLLDGDNEGNGAVTLYREQADGTFGEAITLNDPTFPSSAIATRLTVFVSADNRVHIVGLNDNGQLIMFYQTGQRLGGDPTRWEWFFENVELTHLAVNGQATPEWVDELTVYVAPWNGLNIAGLTAEGDAAVVWWAPGRRYWRADNLSQLTGLPRLVGGLTSYVTPWGGLNVAGIDTDGDLQVVWWVPGVGSQWRANNMTRQFNGQKLEPATVSSYVTPWGGLNIAGIDSDTGAAVVYWWAPGLTAWIPDVLTFNRDPQDPLPSGRMLAVNYGQQLNLFGRADSGEVIRLYWNPGDGSTWGLQNLTRISV